jgi:hypothetical protein
MDGQKDTFLKAADFNNTTTDLMMTLTEQQRVTQCHHFPMESRDSLLLLGL